jgi:hypothetical protein
MMGRNFFVSDVNLETCSSYIRLRNFFVSNVNVVLFHGKM